MFSRTRGSLVGCSARAGADRGGEDPICTSLLFTGSLPASLATPIARADAVLFVLDVSGSMAQKLGAETKMQAAKRVFGELVEKLPEGPAVGLEVYGHRGNKDCSAIEVTVPPGPLDRARLREAVAGLAPYKGATPIAASLRTAADALADQEGRKSIVLISDGEETCDGDPVATAAELREQGYDVTIHTVGFAVGEEETRQLAAVAEAGGGRYFPAHDAEGLAQALGRATELVVAQAQPEAAEPASDVVFRDDFDEEYVRDEWEIRNPNPDAAVVEDGRLLVVTELPNETLFDANNMLLYRGDLPKAYEAETTVYATMYESCTPWHKAQFVGLILFQDPNNAIALVAGSAPNSCDSDQGVQFVRVRTASGFPASAPISPAISRSGRSGCASGASAARSRAGTVSTTEIGRSSASSRSCAPRCASA